MIGKKNFIRKQPMCAQSMHTGAKNSYIEETEAETEAELNETIKSGTLVAVDKPRTRDQSNKELTNFSRIWSVEHKTSF